MQNTPTTVSTLTCVPAQADSTTEDLVAPLEAETEEDVLELGAGSITDSGATMSSSPEYDDCSDELPGLSVVELLLSPLEPSVDDDDDESGTAAGSSGVHSSGSIVEEDFAGPVDLCDSSGMSVAGLTPCSLTATWNNCESESVHALSNTSDRILSMAGLRWV